MNETRIQTLPLNNGLTVGLFDASRKIAGDRWQVTLLARMEIPVDTLYLRAADLPNALETRQALGETVIFEVEKQRNFINEPEKQQVFDDLKDTFIRISLPYLSHPDFPGRYIAKKLAELKRRRSWER